MEEVTGLRTLLHMWKHIFDYRGRASRKEYWIPFLVHAGILIAALMCLGVSAVLAQDAAAQFVGWKDWKELKTVTNTHARHLIAMQQNLDKRVEKNGYKNDIIYNAMAYFDLLKAQNIPYENAQAVYHQLKENLIKAK